MLQIKDIKKSYVTGDIVQTALDGISLNLRENEFVAVLGPSGSGKTTLLNIIGGLDNYDSGDLIIDGASTKKYTDRDWDSYRNHMIGFVFQSYNLIPHQTVLSNVELALTISGISKSHRKKLAAEALEKVGLKDHIYKKPNQLSGGQMQRVAIARALVNDPDIVLADEPTGALDSDTSVQIMDLLKEVAKDRLVVMVTHNDELAEKYATRIIKLKDGKITGDSNPYHPKHLGASPIYRNKGKSSMSLATSLSLSFNNLKTKKARTFLTSFAGSIGIIGIALILSLSNGVNTYISDIQKDTMTSYPISIKAQSTDFTSLLEQGRQEAESGKDEDAGHELDGVYANNSDIEMQSAFETTVNKNNLTEFKKYLDDPDSEIHKYIGENGIMYTYDTNFSVYSHDPDGVLVNTDGSGFKTKSDLNSIQASMQAVQSLVTQSSDNNFEEMIPGTGGALISKAITGNYELVYGKWPEKYNELVLVLDSNNEVSSTALYDLGLLPTSEYEDYMKKIDSGEKITMSEHKWSYEDFCGHEFYLIPSCDFYKKDDSGLYHKIQSNEDIEKLMNNAVKLKISGVIRQNKDTERGILTQPIGYTSALTDYLIKYSDESEPVKAQQTSKDVNILNGARFSPSDDAEKIEDVKKYINGLSVAEKADMARTVLQSVPGISSMTGMDTTDMTDEQLSETLVKLTNSSGGVLDSVLMIIYDSYVSPGSYDDNMKQLGYIDPETPSGINIYTDSFDDKQGVSDSIAAYNSGKSDADKIHYDDYAGLMMSSVTKIVNTISYVLIAFVALSLVVSSIMIGIITYISVLERTKEIGILRSIGASKRNISEVFNAETFIIGLLSGIIGVGISVLLLIPGNAILHAVIKTNEVNAALPWQAAVILVILSIILTLIGGIIPAKKAANKDPVIALRSE